MIHVRNTIQSFARLFSISGKYCIVQLKIPTYQLDMISAHTDGGKELRGWYTLAYIVTPIAVISVVVLVASAVVLKNLERKGL